LESEHFDASHLVDKEIEHDPYLSHDEAELELQPSKEAKTFSL
jgi:hypothetical protein